MMISPNRPRKSVTGLLVIAIIAVILAGCSLNPGDLASSVRSAGDGQSVTVKFANTLNLPEGADVTLNGLRVGSVTEVALRGDHVDVAAKLEHGVRIAAEATASIRQNTVLGDPYLAIRGPETGPALAGGVIPLSRTTAPPPLEDTLAVVANFVNGGSIQNMQDVIRSVNTALPDMAQTKRVAKIAAIDMHSLAVDTRHIDTMITGLDRTSRTVIPRLAKMEEMLSPAGMHYWSQLSRLFSGIGIVLPSIGSVFEGGFWLMPMLTEIDGSIQTVRQGVDAIGENDELLRKFLSNSLFPFMRKPGLDIVSARSPQGEEMIGNMTKVLRILGAIR
jgi:phospholipid/cholesterol/gamma-HCH transport system substrate-binding protein